MGHYSLHSRSFMYGRGGGSICEHEILQTYLLEGPTQCSPGILPRDHQVCNCCVQYWNKHFPETFLYMNI